MFPDLSDIFWQKSPDQLLANTKYQKILLLPDYGESSSEMPVLQHKTGAAKPPEAQTGKKARFHNGYMYSPFTGTSFLTGILLF